MKKIIAISLSLIILMSHVGLSVSTHYCGGEAVRTHIGIQSVDLSCGMEEAKAALPIDCESAISMNSCCDDQLLTADVEDEIQTAKMQLTFDLDFLFVLVAVLSDFTSTQIDHQPSYFDTSPPPLLKSSLQVLFQSFLL
ncbi:HYC_CC_PP family protein [Reichenbachiella ulvae]|uniref:Uncharacterized protein n=1 Tax=Reichenbachiella ulvae TaxID=2980104 RepID=A0ABT3CXZ6_9BACT|nr:hypothetical protein [Reichenbachiella ulvae]MCV9388565.1 hypothetical protein [Reichenbachiella ulvae]